nr:hypothetical protein [Tanacetum cinerariifolium]
TPTPITTAAPVPRLSAVAKGKQPARATTPTEPTNVKRTEAEQLKIGGDEVSESERESDEEETRQEEEESLDPIPRTPEGSEDEGNDKEDQDLRLSEEARIQEEEEADELDAGVESIFMTTSSLIVSLQTPTPIMTLSTIATITTSSDASIPPTTIPSTILENLPTFNSVFRFDERLRSLETTFFEYRVWNATLEVEVLTRSSHSSRTSYAVAADLLEMELKKILIEKMEGNKSIQRSDEQRNLYKAEDERMMEGPSVGSDRGSKRQRERGEHASASTPSETATESAVRSTTGSQSRQLFASESAFAKEPVQTTCQMEEPSHPVFETAAEDQPIVQTLSILNGFPSQGDHHHRIVTRTKLCQLLKEMLNHE